MDELVDQWRAGLSDELSPVNGVLADLFDGFETQALDEQLRDLFKGYSQWRKADTELRGLWHVHRHGAPPGRGDSEVGLGQRPVRSHLDGHVRGLSPTLCDLGESATQQRTAGALSVLDVEGDGKMFPWQADDSIEWCAAHAAARWPEGLSAMQLKNAGAFAPCH